MNESKPTWNIWTEHGVQSVEVPPDVIPNGFSRALAQCNEDLVKAKRNLEESEKLRTNLEAMMALQNYALTSATTELKRATREICTLREEPWNRDCITVDHATWLNTKQEMESLKRCNRILWVSLIIQLVLSVARLFHI